MDKYEREEMHDSTLVALEENEKKYLNEDYM